MSNYGSMIAASADLAIGYGERLLDGITPELFGRLAVVEGHTIESNHPAFAYGHLCLYAPRTLQFLGDDPGRIAVPAKFDEVFSKDAKCVDDPDGSIYPPMNEVTQRFLDGYRAAADALRSAEDELLQQANPNEPMRSRFPTLGSMLGFYVGGHMMLHLGQVSAWRRMVGLGPA